MKKIVILIVSLFIIACESNEELEARMKRDCPLKYKEGDLVELHNDKKALIKIISRRNCRDTVPYKVIILNDGLDEKWISESLVRKIIKSEEKVQYENSWNSFN